MWRVVCLSAVLVVRFEWACVCTTSCVDARATTGDDAYTLGGTTAHVATCDMP